MHPEIEELSHCQRIRREGSRSFTELPNIFEHHELVEENEPLIDATIDSVKPVNKRITFMSWSHLGRTNHSPSFAFSKIAQRSGSPSTRPGRSINQAKSHLLSQRARRIQQSRIIDFLYAGYYNAKSAGNSDDGRVDLGNYKIEKISLSPNDFVCEATARKFCSEFLMHGEHSDSFPFETREKTEHNSDKRTRAGEDFFISRLTSQLCGLSKKIGWESGYCKDDLFLASIRATEEANKLMDCLRRSNIHRHASRAGHGGWQRLVRTKGDRHPALGVYRNGVRRR
ncbi:hypothetical protein K458DRAFT_385862 [Lentithecium fluviatile CBS 122367]|uniref:Uncharacterized protein n=1 Tax=Lentithecium fluviatile CBS 122367 TaxID=1168545 RepID=A0A6G1JA72_9PLEO|nr:hypothetical protein K458DRAFT_385862 [Lentithecium fluviatile CBS 122367]